MNATQARNITLKVQLNKDVFRILKRIRIAAKKGHNCLVANVNKNVQLALENKGYKFLQYSPENENGKIVICWN